jgi:hypothetical protein
VTLTLAWPSCSATTFGCSRVLAGLQRERRLAVPKVVEPDHRQAEPGRPTPEGEQDRVGVQRRPARAGEHQAVLGVAGIALRDPATRLPVAALKRWEVPGGGLEARLFLPDRVVSYTARAGSTVSGWRRTNTIDNLLGVVPVVEFCNRPTITGEGTSELADVVPLQDAVNKLCTDMLVASEFNSFKARYLMVDKDTKQEASNRMVAELKHKSAAFQRYLVTTGGTSVGEFTESTLEGFVAAITLLTQHVATMTQTPPHYFFLRGEFPSGESIQSAEAAWSPRSRTSRSCSARRGSAPCGWRSRCSATPGRAPRTPRPSGATRGCGPRHGGGRRHQEGRHGRAAAPTP